jgi:hypothetical protein
MEVKMSKTTIQWTDNGIEYINEGAKKFHITGTSNMDMFEAWERCAKYIERMRKRGYTRVEILDVYDYGDWCEVYDKDGNLLHRYIVTPENALDGMLAVFQLH